MKLNMKIIAIDPAGTTKSAGLHGWAIFNNKKLERDRPGLLK